MIVIPPRLIFSHGVQRTSKDSISGFPGCISRRPCCPLAMMASTYGERDDGGGESERKRERGRENGVNVRGNEKGRKIVRVSEREREKE